MFTQEQSQEIIQRRHNIVLGYCKQKGWVANPQTMTMQQIMEIRATQEWKEVPERVLNGSYNVD